MMMIVVIDDRADMKIPVEIVSALPSLSSMPWDVVVVSLDRMYYS